MTITREHIKIANELYEMRDVCKMIAGEKYLEDVAQYLAILKGRMRLRNCNGIQAFISISKDLEKEFGNRAAHSIMWFGAAVVEETEVPTTALNDKTTASESPETGRK